MNSTRLRLNPHLVYGMLALGVGAYRVGGTKPSNASSRLGRLPTPRGNGETSSVVTAPTRADGKSKRLPSL